MAKLFPRFAGAVAVGFLVVTGVARPAEPIPPAPVSLAMLAPPPASSIAFCRAHGGDCDPVPPAAPMLEGKPALTPIAWRDYCRRNREDPACVR